MNFSHHEDFMTIEEENLDLLDLLFLDCEDTDEHFIDNGMEKIFRGLKSIIKWRRSEKENNWGAPPTTTKTTKKKKSVVFRDPLCEVRLYDKVAAKRQQWGHARKFCRVKRFCWDKDVDLDTALRGTQKDMWLMDQPDLDYRQMLLRDLQKRRLHRKRRQNGQDLEFMVQRLEISPNCVEIVRSKMRRADERM